MLAGTVCNAVDACIHLHSTEACASSLYHESWTHLDVWQRQVDDSVESARPGEGRVQGCRPIGGSHDHHACVVLKPIHLCQQLVDGVH